MPIQRGFSVFLRCVCQITRDLSQRKIRLDMQTFFHYLTYCIHRPIWSLWPIIESGTLFGLDYRMFMDSLTPGQLLSEPHTRQFQSTVAIKVSVSEPTTLYFGRNGFRCWGSSVAKLSIVHIDFTLVKNFVCNTSRRLLLWRIQYLPALQHDRTASSYLVSAVLCECLLLGSYQG